MEGHVLPLVRTAAAARDRTTGPATEGVEHFGDLMGGGRHKERLGHQPLTLAPDVGARTVFSPIERVILFANGNLQRIVRSAICNIYLHGRKHYVCVAYMCGDSDESACV